MPFWQAVKRCENCRKWRDHDPSQVLGTCEHEVVTPRPFWKMGSQTFHTAANDGRDCDVYEHDAHKPHLLDSAVEFLASVLVGDKIPMRTYERNGNSSHCHAEVLAFGKGWAKVRMLGADFRMRTVDTKRGRAGTILALPTWGVDTQSPILRKEHSPDHPELAAAMLAKVKAGDTIKLRGLPPFDGMTRTVKVNAVSPEWIRFRMDGRKRRMQRRGLLAGVIEGDLWYLDTETVDAGTTEAAT